MTKNEQIAKYGIEWYNRQKEITKNEDLVRYNHD